MPQYSMDEMVTVLRHYHIHNLLTEEVEVPILSRIYALSGGMSWSSYRVFQCNIWSAVTLQRQ